MRNNTKNIPEYHPTVIGLDLGSSKTKIASALNKGVDIITN
jgi:hypothetical protein